MQITAVASSSPDYTVNYNGSTLQPGQSVALEITYKGGATSQGSGVITMQSNDPDENPLPIQVLGNTTYLNPGDPSVDFTLPTLVPDPNTGLPISGSPFNLMNKRGKAVWFSISGTW